MSSDLVFIRLKVAGFCVCVVVSKQIPIFGIVQQKKTHGEAIQQQIEEQQIFGKSHTTQHGRGGKGGVIENNKIKINKMWVNLV